MSKTNGNTKGRVLEVGNPLFRRDKHHPDEPAQKWGTVEDVITSDRVNGTEWVAVLVRGIDGSLFTWRTYFTENRNGKLAFGQYGPQAPLCVDEWIAEQIANRGWYSRIKK